MPFERLPFHVFRVYVAWIYSWYRLVCKQYGMVYHAVVRDTYIYVIIVVWNTAQLALPVGIALLFRLR